MMKKTYNPYDIEQCIYKFWEKNGYFKPNGDKSKKSFCIMTPPPNITGSLHMGHAFQQTIMDIMIRYQRMQGRNTLWQTGTDHAGIATQIVVERKIVSEEGKTRHNYTRSEFVQKIWKWKLKSGSIINDQIRRLGSSVDWERARFTMDEGFSNAVKEVFIHLYKENLIYRGKRLVNWDPKLCTAVSDLEVENRESKGYVWYIRYPLADGEKTPDGKNYLVVATTRPETLLGDTGIAVNQEDPRYKGLNGKFVILPFVNRRIPIIFDKHANMKKGTGCVKITPAHDFKDYEVGRRHQLPMINIFTSNGNIREHAEVFEAGGNHSDVYSSKIPLEFQKLERFSARKAIVDSIDSLGLLEEIRFNDPVVISYSDRSGTIIEPMLTDQWYVRSSILAKPAIEAVKNGSIKFIQKKYENMYFSWMNNIQDWCISRQIWWGHRIPAWYDEHKNIYVGRSEEEVRRENNLNVDIPLNQDEDVLDTWFSSSLWTFSSLGWPEDTSSLNQFHPTSVIVSGYDIIFFWIARMIMMTMHFIKDKDGRPQVPFEMIYITGLICDEEGHKMSKSRGNVIDPLDLVDGISLKELLRKRTDNMIFPHLSDTICKRTKKQFPNGIQPYGTDSLRFSLASLSSTNRNINWDMKRLEGYRNFCNKLWNASRFVFMNTENQDCGFSKNDKILSLADRWIIIEFNQTVKVYRESLDNFRFDISTGILYEFIWNKFCDWYLELTKSFMKKAPENKLRGIRHTLITILESLLRLAHPIIPFITEIIWQRVKIIAGIKADTIMLRPFPEFDETLVDETAFSDIEWLKKVIAFIRNIRAEMNLSSERSLSLLLRDCDHLAIRRVYENQNILKDMAHLEGISVLKAGEKSPHSITRTIEGAEIMVPVTGYFNKTIKLESLRKDIEKVEMEIFRIKNKLENKNFINYAPEEIVFKERKKLEDLFLEREKLLERYRILTKV